MRKTKLYYCGNCKEDSMVIKVYRNEGEPFKRRVQYCKNKGCGRKYDLPILKDSVQV